MFLGELGLKGLRKTGGTFEYDSIPVKGTIGYSVKLTHQTEEDGSLTTYFQTNIPQEIWVLEESSLLREKVAQLINPRGNEVRRGMMTDTHNVIFMIIPQANISPNTHVVK